MSKDATAILLVTKGEDGMPEYRPVVVQPVEDLFRELFADASVTEFDLRPSWVKSNFEGVQPVNNLDDAEIRLRDVVRSFNESNVPIVNPQFTVDLSILATYEELLVGHHLR